MDLWGNGTTKYTKYTKEFENGRYMQWGQQPTLTPAYAVGPSRPTFLPVRNKYVTLSPVTTNHLICAFLRRVIIQMKRLGLNQTQLAKRMKVSRPYVTKLLSGDVNITFGTAMRLAQALQMDFFPDLREKTEPEVAAVPSAT